MPRYVVRKGIVNGQLRGPDGIGPAKEIYKFKEGEVFESKDFPKLSEQALEHMVKNGTIERTKTAVAPRVKEKEIEREENAASKEKGA